MTLRGNKYKDTWVKLAGSLFCSHFIEAMGRTEGFFQLLFKKSYLVALLSGFLIAFVLWELISRLTVWLDARYDWLAQTVQRIFLQLLLGVFLPAALLYVLTFVQMRILFQQDINAMGYLVNEFPAACLLIMLINTYYLTYYFYNRATVPVVTAPLPLAGQAPPAVMTSPEIGAEKTNTILINKGAKTLPLPAEGIAYAYKNGDHTYIKTVDG